MPSLLSCRQHGIYSVRVTREIKRSLHSCYCATMIITPADEEIVPPCKYYYSSFLLWVYSAIARGTVPSLLLSRVRHATVTCFADSATSTEEENSPQQQAEVTPEVHLGESDNRVNDVSKKKQFNESMEEKLAIVNKVNRPVIFMLRFQVYFSRAAH